MSKSTYGVRRAGLASIATMSLVTAAAVAGAGAASATTDFKFQRIGGADRYETSTLVADQFATTNPSVILANGEPGNYADALSANTLAGEKNIPVLLTRKDKTPQYVLDQLKEDGTKTITVVGGTSVVSDAQVAALTAAGYAVTRIAGSDRFATNADIIAASGAAAGATGLIATGFNFPDALAAGPVSFQGHPLGLSTKDSIDDEVVAALKAAGVTKVLIFGGESAVGAGVVTKLAANGITVTERFAGTDRADTSAKAAEFAVKNLSFTNTHVGVASGYVKGFGADALAGGPLEGKEKSPMLVTRDVNVPGASVLAYLKNHAATLKDGHLYGGTAAISAAAQAEMEKAAQSVSTNQSFTASPSAGQTVERGTVSQFTFSGITSSTVDIALVGCENITTDASGVSTFPNSSNPGGTGNIANLGGADAANDITVINGTASNSGQYANNVTVTNGSVSFTVTNGAIDCYVAVVFADANNDDHLNLGTNNQPTEAFANSGDVNVIAPEAVDHDTTIGTVTSLDKAANRFSTATETFYYDSNDEFFLEAGATDTALTLDQFEARLSAGDSVAGDYRNNPANQSSFTLTDSAPAAPTGVTTQAPTGANAGKPGLEVKFNDSATPSVASYDVYRATAIQPVITGQEITCPATDQYTKLASVTDTNAATYTYYDATVQQPATGTSNPSYCYYVVSVDQTGDTSAPSTPAGPATAYPAAPAATSPKFTQATASGTTITLVYSESIDCNTVDLNGSDFAANYTTGGVTTANNPTAAVCDNFDHDTNVATPNVGRVVLTVGAQPAGSTVVVTAKAGTDTDTVGDNSTPKQYQAVGDAVQDVVN